MLRHKVNIKLKAGKNKFLKNFFYVLGFIKVVKGFGFFNYIFCKALLGAESMSEIQLRQ